jgi:GntR family transcriptional regulator
VTTLLKSSVPLYAQLEAALRESIRKGLWGPGTALPSDRDMASQWHVSRCTVRQALDALVRDGIIERRQGKGTFVVLSEALRDFIGYYAIDGPGEESIRFGTRVLSFEPVDPPLNVTEYLRVMPGVRVMRLRLLRVANEVPAILLTSYIPVEECATLSAEDFASSPVLTQVLTDKGIPVVSQRRSIHPVLIDGEDAELLGVERGSLGLRMDRISYTDFRQPVEYGTTLMRGDVVSYTLDIGRPSGSSGRVLRHSGELTRDQIEPSLVL